MKKKQKSEDKNTPKISIENCQKINLKQATGECINKGKCIHQSILMQGKIYCLRCIPLTKIVIGD